MGAQFGFVEVATGWLVALLLYPGLLFGVVVVLAGEWLFSVLRLVLARRVYRVRLRPHHLLQPLYDTLRLTGRHEDATNTHYALRITYLLAPILALAPLPFPGSPIVRSGDVFVILALVSLQPVCEAVKLLNDRDPLAAFTGGRTVGRLMVGLFPILVAVAALVAASGGRSLWVADLAVAPETGWQALVRLLAGASLLVALPWWTAHGANIRVDASVFAGQRLQRVTLAAFWAALVLPMSGDLTWALVVTISGTLSVYVIMRVLSERVAPTMREGDAARLAWLTALPLAVLSLIIAWV
jgi:hypothetical protein